MKTYRQSKQFKFISTLAMMAGIYFTASSAFAGSATLSWAANQEPDLARYDVYIRPASGSYSSPQNVGLATSFTFNSLTEGMTYYFGVRAYDTSQNASPMAEISYLIPITPVCTDIDHDGYGNPGSTSCLNGSALDCNDNNSAIHPNATELHNGVDENCNGMADEPNSGPGSLSFVANPPSGTAPFTTTFTCSAIDSNGDTLQYSFDFGDGSSVVTQISMSTSHTYSAAGSYPAACTVRDLFPNGIPTGRQMSRPLTVVVSPPASGSTCAVPGTISAAGGTVTGTTSGSSAVSTQAYTATAQAPEFVYQWIPNFTGSTTLSTCGNNTFFDTVLYIRSASCSSGPDLAVSDDASGCAVVGDTSSHQRGSRITLNVTSGQRYFVVVDGYYGSTIPSSGPFQLFVQTPNSAIASKATNNLIVNSSCEIAGVTPGSIPYWTSVSGRNWNCGHEVAAAAGSYHFFPGAWRNADGTTINNVELRQDIDLSTLSTSIDAGVQLIDFDGSVRNWAAGNAYSRVRIDYLNAAKTQVLSFYDSGEISNPSSWRAISDARVVPVGARAARVRLMGRYVSGTDIDAYFDALSLKGVVSVDPVRLLSEKDDPGPTEFDGSEVIDPTASITSGCRTAHAASLALLLLSLALPRFRKRKVST